MVAEGDRALRGRLAELRLRRAVVAVRGLRGLPLGQAGSRRARPAAGARPGGRRRAATAAAGPPAPCRRARGRRRGRGAGGVQPAPGPAGRAGAGVKGALLRYRVLANVVGVILVVFLLVAMPLKYLFEIGRAHV